MRRISFDTDGATPLEMQSSNVQTSVGRRQEKGLRRHMKSSALIRLPHAITVTHIPLIAAFIARAPNAVTEQILRIPMAPLALRPGVCRRSRRCTICSSRATNASVPSGRPVLSAA
jgi:hypothetical protein